MPSIMRILVGLPASGKSTYALNLAAEDDGKWARINYDQFRHGQDGELLYTYSRKAEEAIKANAIAYARVSAAEGLNLVIDNTNLSRSTIDRWVALAHELEMEVEIIDFEHVPLEVCIARDAARTGWRRVGRPVIERMALWAGLITFPLDKQLVLVDVDGTIADGSHRLHFLQQEKKDHDGYFAQAHADEPILPVIELVQRIATFYHVCIVSGRPDDKCGQQTLEWLDKYKVPFEHIFMRQGGDHRPDFLVKNQILDRLPKQQIAFVLDDRKQVVDMWRRHRVRVFQVADGNF